MSEVRKTIAQLSARPLVLRCGSMAKVVVRLEMCQECGRGCEHSLCPVALDQWRQCFACNWMAQVLLN